MFIIFDTETTGLPKNSVAPHTDTDNWPRVVQLAWQLHEDNGKLIHAANHIVYPDGFTIPFNAEKVHGISTERAQQEGNPLQDVLEKFEADLINGPVLVAHNIEFDLKTIGAEFVRLDRDTMLHNLEQYDTSEQTKDFCRLKGGKGGGFKTPKLAELHTKLFGEAFEDAHDAAYDVSATAKCFFELLKRKVNTPEVTVSAEDITYEAPKLKDANFRKVKTRRSAYSLKTNEQQAAIISQPFYHLHVHSQYSVLQATPDVKSLVSTAKKMEMPAIALTDFGNMFGAFTFVHEALKEGIKPIVGCELFVAEERLKLKFTKDNPDRRFQQLLLAKHKKGYHNLSKLSSLGYIEGYYAGYPRVDKKLIAEYKEGLIALTGGLSGEIPNLILNVGEQQAEEAFVWWLERFRDDFYVQLQRHGLEPEDRVNEVLIRFADKYDVKIIPSNEVYYVQKENSDAQDILLCIKDNEFFSTPKGFGRGYRYGLSNSEYYLKSQMEMKSIFSDIPEAFEGLEEILNKIEAYELKRNVLLPAFEIPKPFKSEDEYLHHLTFEGAKKRYTDITDEIRERLEFELDVIKKTGYPGYFLIVQDFTNKAREMGVSVGPGRGSAAGSAVAYCIGITNVDPIKYDLLFERFLNPDRVSLPDIDIDFDDDGRGKVIEYVVDKYGFNQVAQIITYGKMAAKSSIRDSARVMELPLDQANKLASMVPEKPGTNLEAAFKEIAELATIEKGTDKQAEVLKQARIVEGSVRNTGLHACGIIITPDDITNHIPVAVSRDSTLLNTQFDNSVVESAGMLKMDFLGLKTLSIIKTAVKNIEKRHGIKLDSDEFPLDDPATYELYQKGLTNGTFQFESPGMQKHLQNLKPDRFEDLIAMNALYRPGPMEYIPNFIKRKHGQEEIVYDLPEMEEYLKETYGITVYQEQVMLLSQKLAGFTKGQADSLRKAMGKKIQSLMEELKPKFLGGCKQNGHPEKIALKIWDDWEAFARYAFNKSHSTCYSIVAYQTGYLKANYPAEYMAAVLSHNQNNIEKVTFFMDECRHLGIRVLGPDVNESNIDFDVNEEGEIRFGLGAIKGAGENAMKEIIESRNSKDGLFKDFFDFAKRLNLRAVNKKVLESLAMAGALDNFGFHRRQYLYAPEGETNLIERTIKYAAKVQQEEESAQVSLFGGDSNVQVPPPKVEEIEPYSNMDRLRIEKEVIGFYLSGHPLDQFRPEFDNFCTCSLAEYENYKNQEIRVAGIITQSSVRISKNGNPYGIFTLEDYEGSAEMIMFGETFRKNQHLISKDEFVFISARVEQRRDQIDKWNLRPVTIQLLAEIREKLVKELHLYLPLFSIDESVVTKLKELTEQYKGNCKLRLKIKDPDENTEIEMGSRKYRIFPSNEFLQEIKKIPDVLLKMVS